MASYEIEIKTLLGDRSRAEELTSQLVGRGATLTGKSKQLNHYFILSDARRFKEALAPQIGGLKRAEFEKILSEGSNFSIRTREADGKVLLVIKASIGSDTSANGVSRLEFEAEMNMSLGQLDERLVDAGLEYQAKWSREREEYKLGEVNVCVDKNAGYGYLAEFERVVPDAAQANEVKSSLLSLMDELGVEELPQDRLERMFAHYNANWRDYYGTDKVFTIE